MRIRFDSRLAGVVLLALLQVGCGMFGSKTEEEEPSELPDIDQRFSPKELWSRDTGIGTGDSQLNLRPWVEKGVVYAADSSGRVLAVDGRNGKVLWDVDTDSRVSGGPGGGLGLILIGTEDAEVIALDAANGAELWRARVSSEVLATPAVGLDTVVLHTIDGKLIGLEAATGQERWRFDREIPVLTLRGSSSPVIEGAVAYCGLAGGKLVAVDIRTGAPIWDLSVSVPRGRSELERLADIDGDPLLIGNDVFVTTFQGEVASVTQRGGALNWKRSLSAYNGPDADWRHVYVSDAEGVLWALDADSGNALWRQEQLKLRRLSPPAVFGDYVVVGDYQGYLHWVSPEDGALVARQRIGSGPISTRPRVVGETLYVLGADGELAAIALPQTGP
jgi:outer membrane protein assembly factor BamB